MFDETVSVFHPNFKPKKNPDVNEIKQSGTIFNKTPKKSQAKKNTMTVDAKPTINEPKIETPSGTKATYLGTELKTTQPKSLDDFLSSPTPNVFGTRDVVAETMKKNGYKKKSPQFDWSVQPKKNEYQWRPKYEPKEIESQSGPRFEAKQSEPEQERDSFMDWTGKQIMRGISNFNDDWASLLNWVLPTELIFKDKDPFVWLDNYYSGLKDYYTEEAERSSLSRGKGWNTAGDILSTAVEFIPDLAITLMSGGSSLAGKGLQAASLGSKVAGRGKLFKEIGEEIVDYAKKNPQDVISYLKYVSDAYGSAKERGATDWEAALSGVVKSAANVGLDTLNLPDSKNGEVVDIIFESAKDSVNGVINRGTDKLIFDEDMKMFSLGDEDAVFNLSDLGNDFYDGVSSEIISEAVNAFNDLHNTSKEKEYKQYEENLRKYGKEYADYMHKTKWQDKIRAMTDEEFDEYIKRIAEVAN